MAYDIAVHPDTGDWIFAANADIQAVQGEQVIEQRIRTRLRISQGWQLDSDGTLGSNVYTLSRVQRGRVLGELPLLVREALAPMTDILVDNVQSAENPEDERQVFVYVDYSPAVSEGEVNVPDQARKQLQITLDL